MNELKITPELVAALTALRGFARGEAGWSARKAMDVLDNAGIFQAIDTATDYTGELPSGQVSRCTCPEGVAGHLNGCPGDPAEWGDLAYSAI